MKNRPKGYRGCVKSPTIENVAKLYFEFLGEVAVS